MFCFCFDLGGGSGGYFFVVFFYVCVCVCVCDKEREREREREFSVRAKLTSRRINFYLLRTFCPHLGSYFFLLSRLFLRFGQISPLAFFR